MFSKKDKPPLPPVINGKVKITENFVIEKGIVKAIKRMNDPKTAKMSYFFLNAENQKIYVLPCNECPYDIDDLHKIV